MGIDISTATVVGVSFVELMEENGWGQLEADHADEVAACYCLMATLDPDTLSSEYLELWAKILLFWEARYRRACQTCWEQGFCSSAVHRWKH